MNFNVPRNWPWTPEIILIAKPTQLPELIVRTKAILHLRCTFGSDKNNPFLQEYMHHLRHSEEWFILHSPKHRSPYSQSLNTGDTDEVQ